MKKNLLLAVWMVVVAAVSIVYVSTNSGRHPELIGIVLIILFAFLGIMVGLSLILKRLDDKESKQR